MDKWKKQSREQIAVFVMLLLFLGALFMIAYYFPLVGDDFYGIDDYITSVRSFIEWAVWHWENTNGRILGNTTVLLVMHSRIGRAFVRAFIIWLIMILVYQNSRIISKAGYLLSYLYVLAIPTAIFSETYSWTFGFFNYVPPVMLVLFYLVMVQKEFSKRTAKWKGLKIVGTFLLGVCSQLFMENVTIYVLIMSIAINIFYIRKEKRVSAVALFHTLGAAAGTLLMFSSPVYRTVTAGTDTYREAPDGIAGLFQAARENWCEISKYTVRGNILLLIMVLLICFWLLYKNAREKDIRTRILRTINSCILTGTSAYFFFANILEWDEKIEAYTAFFLLDVLMFVLFIISVMMTVILCVKETEQRSRSLFFLISAFVLVGPLLFVTPVGPRCFYASYIFTGLAFLNIVAYIIEQEHWNLRRLAAPACVLMACVTAYYLYIFFNIGEVEQERDSYIIERMQEGDTVIMVPEFPYSDYLHDPHGWKIGLKFYYEKQEDIEFCFIPYSEWTGIKKE